MADSTTLLHVAVLGAIFRDPIKAVLFSLWVVVAALSPGASGTGGSPSAAVRP